MIFCYCGRFKIFEVEKDNKNVKWEFSVNIGDDNIIIIIIVYLGFYCLNVQHIND